jgi:hypothetical protein
MRAFPFSFPVVPLLIPLCSVPEASVVLGRKVIPVQPLPSFIKDEADESNGDDDGESNGEYESNGDVEEMSVDDYDRDDPFM